MRRDNLFIGRSRYEPPSEDMVELFRKKAEAEDLDKCSVRGCDLPVKRSMSAEAVHAKVPGLQFKGKDPRRVRLCKEHYKEYKKATREDRKLDRLSWGH